MTYKHKYETYFIESNFWKEIKLPHNFIYLTLHRPIYSMSWIWQPCPINIENWAHFRAQSASLMAAFSNSFSHARLPLPTMKYSKGSPVMAMN